MNQSEKRYRETDGDTSVTMNHSNMKLDGSIYAMNHDGLPKIIKQ